MAAIKSGASNQQSSAKLPVKAGFSLSPYQMNAFHDQLHDLRTGDDGASPADHSPFQLAGRLMRNSEIIWRLPGGELCEVGDQAEHVGVVAPTAGGYGYGKQQGRKKARKG
jgi:hypothetical protein